MIKNLRPFRFFCYKVIPLIYDDSLSYYELLCKVVDYLNKVIENVNGFEENIEVMEHNIMVLQNYIDNYFDNLDVTEEINNKLDEMFEDGTLEDIIRNYIPTSNICCIEPEYISTWALKDGRYTQTQTHDAIQSFCMIDDTTAVATAIGNYGSSNTIKVFKFDVVSGEQIGNMVEVNAGHGNDICFDGEYLNICWTTYFADGEEEKQPSNKITRIDTDLNMIDIITLDDVQQIGTISYGDDKFYIGSGDLVYVYNSDLTIVEKIITLKDVYRNTYYYNQTTRFVLQTMEYVNKRLNIVYSYPCVMITYDLNGNLLNVYNFPFQCSNGGNLGEIEAIKYNPTNGYYYGFGYGRMGLGDVSINTYFRFNLIKGQVDKTIVTATTRFNLPGANIYVDGTISDNAKMLGTSAQPFKYIQQAIDYSRLELQPSVIVARKLASVTNYGTISIGKLSNIRITTDDSGYNTNVNHFFIPRAHIEESSNIHFYYMNIDDLEIVRVEGITFGSCKINEADLNRAYVASIRNASTYNKFKARQSFMLGYGSGVAPVRDVKDCYYITAGANDVYPPEE